MRWRFIFVIYARIFLQLRFNDSKQSPLSTPSELTNQKPVMLSVSRAESINILYALPCSCAGCLQGVLTEFASVAVKLDLDASCPQTLCTLFFRLLVPFPAASTPEAGSSPSWSPLAFVHHLGLSRQVISQKNSLSVDLRKYWKNVWEAKALSQTSLVSVPRVFGLGGYLPYLLMDCLLIYSLLGRGNLWYFTLCINTPRRAIAALVWGPWRLSKRLRRGVT